MDKKVRIRAPIVWRVVLTLLSGLWLAFIFSNSLRTGEQSSEQSSVVVNAVQNVVAVFAPDSPIVNATGAEYERLHKWVRKGAHFAEYALLGALLYWCYFSYTSNKKWAVLPVVGTALVPFIDEGLQLLTAGRAGMFTDVLIDLFGGAIGLSFAYLTVWLFIVKKKKGE